MYKIVERKELNTTVIQLKIEAPLVAAKAKPGQFINIQILSSLVNGLCGYQWWCAWDQMHLDFSPYTWSLMERQLGLFDKDRKPKPVALTMQKMAKAIVGKLVAD